MIIPLHLLLPLVMELAMVSMVVVSMSFVVLIWVCVSLAADLMMVVRVEGLVLMDGGL